MNTTNAEIIKRSIFLKNIALLMIFTTELHLVFPVNFVFADKSTDHASRKVNARRQLPFGITYPYGYHPPHNKTDQWPPLVTDPVFTARTIVTADRYPWRSAASIKTPPTLYFPFGSSPVTVTEFALPHMYIDPRSKANPCELYIRDCLRAYDTGYLCAKALHNTYFTFNNYCAMEFANCQSKTTMWQVAYFGNCALVRIPSIQEDINIEGEDFLEAAVINSPPFDPMKEKQVSY